MAHKKSKPRGLSAAEIAGGQLSERPYSGFDEIDGSHPLKSQVPDFCVEYQARIRPGGSVAFFNFELAKEMGLIPTDHPTKMNGKLEKKILETFSLIIINEWDLENQIKFPPSQMKKNTYMATRYLQLQHDDKNGKNSGDGRSLWNGQFKRNGIAWDISSCGTGATRLSPATSKHGKFFQSGDPGISYGCGTADYPDAVAAVMMSEIFAAREVPTERCLAVIRYKNDTSVNVRAARNLIRPAHLFRYLKQNRVDELRLLVDHFMEREIENGHMKRTVDLPAQLLQLTADAFARSSALFERDYIFCWFDWDGDNILAENAAILDYGSIRQFGLFHTEYRYDDIERFSTNILEQKEKARYIVQTYAQLVDFITTGKKRPITDFEKCEALKVFDERFAYYKRFFLLKKVGVAPKLIPEFLTSLNGVLDRFESDFEALERIQSKIGVYKVEDGVTSNAVFSMRDFLREFPKVLMSRFESIDPAEFMNMIRSSYATEQDLVLNKDLKARLQSLQKSYMTLIERLAVRRKQTVNRTLLEITMRSSLINRFDQITGNGILRATDLILKVKTDVQTTQSLIDEFVRFQSEPKTVLGSARDPQQRRNLLRLVTIIKDSREEI
jgi:hypothetical protein